MGSNFFSDDFFGWEEDDDENIRSAAEGAEGEPIVEFDDAQYWVDDTDDYQRTARQISRIIEIAINEEGLPIVGEILKTLETRLGWRMEVTAEASLLEDTLYHTYNTYDEDIWLQYVNSLQFHKLSRDIYHVSSEAAADFMNEYMGNKRPFKKHVRNFLWTIVKRLDFS